MKKFLFITVVLSMYIVSSAQETTIKQAVVTKHEQLMNDISKFDEKLQLGKCEQFLLEDSKVTLITGKKDKNVNLSSVYSSLLKNKNNEKVDIQEALTEFIKIDSNGFDGAKKSIFTITAETHYKIQKEDVLSNAKYLVTFKWSVKTKGTPKPVLESITKKTLKYTSAEKKAMEDAAKNSVIDWYASLPNNIDGKYQQQSTMEISPVTLTQNNIKGVFDKNFHYIIEESPSINIYVPFEVPEEEQAFYESNPTAYYQLDIIFDFTFDDNLNPVMNVSYKEGELVPPTYTEEKEHRQDLAQTLAEDFYNNLMRFVKEPTKQNRNELMNMFDNKTKDIVEVSYIGKNTNEKIRSRVAENYFSRLKATNMEIEYEQAQYGPNMENVIFPFLQTYNSSQYNDYTQKELHLKYVDGKYVIEKIMVIPNSTRLQ